MNSRRYKISLLVVVMASIWLLPVQAQDDLHTAVYDDVRIVYPSLLATGLQIEAIDAIPMLDPDTQMHVETYPEHLRFSFLNYMDGSQYRLPYPFAAPQILIYPTDSVREFGYEYTEQLNALDTLLRDRPDLAPFVGATVRLPEIRLPFLPWINSGQVLRSHPQYIDITQNGSGIRYITYYSQEAAHITDQQIFYTFQGIVGKGAYYVSAILPVKTGVLPEEVDTSDVDWDAFGMNYSNYLTETFAQIDSVPDDAFNPSLNVLDKLVQSISVELPR